MKASYWFLFAFFFLAVGFLLFGVYLIFYVFVFAYTFGPFFVFSLVAYGLSYLASKPVKKGRILVRLVAWTILLPIFLGFESIVYHAVRGYTKEVLETITYFFTNPLGQAIFAVAWFTGFLFMLRQTIGKKLHLLHRKNV